MVSTRFHGSGHGDGPWCAVDEFAPDYEARSDIRCSPIDCADNFDRLRSRPGNFRGGAVVLRPGRVGRPQGLCRTHGQCRRDAISKRFSRCPLCLGQFGPRPRRDIEKKHIDARAFEGAGTKRRRCRDPQGIACEDRHCRLRIPYNCRYLDSFRHCLRPESGMAAVRRCRSYRSCRSSGHMGRPTSRLGAGANRRRHPLFRPLAGTREYDETRRRGAAVPHPKSK